MSRAGFEDILSANECFVGFPIDARTSRYILTSPHYTMPLDTFGDQHQEPSFGQLSVGEPSGGQVQISWLGEPCVHLQTATALGTGAVWQDHWETDGTNWMTGHISPDGFVSVTNYPASNGNTLFRLIKPFF